MNELVKDDIQGVFFVTKSQTRQWEIYEEWTICMRQRHLFYTSHLLYYAAKAL